MKNIDEKNKEIEETKKKLSKHLNLIDESKKSVAQYLIAEIAFMSCILQELKLSILTNGLTDEYQNGANQSGIKQSANLQAYNSTAKTYNTIFKQFIELFDKTAQKALSHDDEFMQFMAKSKSIKK